MANGLSAGGPQQGVGGVGQGQRQPPHGAQQGKSRFIRQKQPLGHHQQRGQIMHADVAEAAAEVGEFLPLAFLLGHQHELIDQVRYPDVQGHGTGEPHVGQNRPQPPSGPEARAKQQQLIHGQQEVALIGVKAEHPRPDPPPGDELRVQQKPHGIQ